MKLYNTLTKRVDEIEPLEDGKINLFVCGPTVYDYAHIGHAKTYIQFDVLARVLRANYDLFYLQNITDIDDKIIIRAQESNTSWKELGERFEAAYYEDMETLNVTSISQYAKATDYMSDIVRQVQTLIDKGHAYATDDGIYFEIDTFPEYGKLSGRQEIKEGDAQTRIDQSDQKRGWNDFALWKFSKPGEPAWEAPFGKGRPGWHIEDTAISEHFFGSQYDMHGGAIDLIFPHHEAEITQMEATSGKAPFVSHWVHTGFLNIDQRKMSKSLGNFFTIREVLEKNYDTMAVRILMLQSHYRSPINFSWEALDEAQNRLKNLRFNFSWIYQSDDSSVWPPEVLKEELANFKHKIMERLEDDLDTPGALAFLHECADSFITMRLSQSDIASTEEFADFVLGLLGIDILDRDHVLPDELKILISRREQARKDQDWQKSDELRDQLVEQGIGLRDTPQGVIWYRL